MVKHMKYPNNIKKNYKKEINYKNRGMDLENLINEACKYYLEHNLAVIYKKPTPIGIVDVDYKMVLLLIKHISKNHLPSITMVYGKENM